jgi:HemY protein
MGLVWFIQELLYAPARLSRGWRKRNAEHGRAAISRGLIAVAAGDLRTAERAMQDASRRAGDLPLARTASGADGAAEGRQGRGAADLQDMTEDHATRIAGLRGLYIEAEREGEHEAARQIAERAREEAPSAPWAARALLRHQTAREIGTGRCGRCRAPRKVASSTSARHDVNAP